MAIDMLKTEGGGGKNFPIIAHLFNGETQGGQLTQVTSRGIYESMHICHNVLDNFDAYKLVKWKVGGVGWALGYDPWCSDYL